MKTTPACFGHLTHMLKSLAGGKLVVILQVCPNIAADCSITNISYNPLLLSLQGDYCIKSLAGSAMYTLRALLDELLPVLPPLRQLDPEYCSPYSVFSYLINKRPDEYYSIRIGEYHTRIIEFIKSIKEFRMLINILL